MAYATSDMIKLRIGIPTADTTRDAEITAAVVYGDARCDAIIEEAEGSTPVGSPTQKLKEAASDFGAYYIHRADGNTDLAKSFLASGKTIMGQYISGEVSAAGAQLTGREGELDSSDIRPG